MQERYIPLRTPEEKRQSDLKREMIQKDVAPGGELYDSNFHKSFKELGIEDDTEKNQD
jgi:hypothetical protein